jgi:transposase
MDQAGERLAARQLPEGLIGIGRLHALLAERAEEPGQVVVGIEIDRGLWVSALNAAGYQVFAINPLAVARYRDRHHVSGAKSDTSDAELLADLVRTDRHNHRLIAGDSAGAEAIKCSPGPIRAFSGRVPGTPTRCAARCASTTQPRWRPSRT